LLFVTKHDVVPHIQAELLKELYPYGRPWTVVMSYKDILKQKLDVVPSYDIVVFDESHDVFKKPKLVKQLKRYVYNNFVVLLTGSAGSLREIQRQWTSLVAEGDPIVFSALPEHLQSVVKNAHEHVVQLELSEFQKRVYEKQKQVVTASIKNIDKVNGMVTLRRKLSSWKLPYVREVLVDAIVNKLKVVVFSEFAANLVELRLSLPSDTIVVCDGSVGPKQRRMALDEFNLNTSKHVLIASSKLLAHGVDLGHCHGLIHMEPPWLRHTQQQTNARIARIGQVKIQKILFVLFQDTLETKLFNSNNHHITMI
jgi:hypothetical protein